MPLRDEVLHQALALSPADQAYVASALQQHLNAGSEAATVLEDARLEPALLSELRSRSAAYATGQTTARDAVELLAELRRRQSTEATP